MPDLARLPGLPTHDPGWLLCQDTLFNLMAIPPTCPSVDSGSWLSMLDAADLQELLSAKDVTISIPHRLLCCSKTVTLLQQHTNEIKAACTTMAPPALAYKSYQLQRLRNSLQTVATRLNAARQALLCVDNQALAASLETLQEQFSNLARYTREVRQQLKSCQEEQDPLFAANPHLKRGWTLYLRELRRWTGQPMRVRLCIAGRDPSLLESTSEALTALWRRFLGRQAMLRHDLGSAKEPPFPQLRQELSQIFSDLHPEHEQLRCAMQITNLND